jgi:hypothetical protein
MRDDVILYDFSTTIARHQTRAKKQNCMKVGILTFHRGPNYGGFLQAWHMREAIRSFGHDATLINYQGTTHHQAEQVRFRGLRPRQLKGLALHWLKSRPFNTPVSELSDHAFSYDATQIPWQRFDRVVVGADVVWNFTNHVHGHDPVFFGAHPAQQQTSFAAYAPSCGDTPINGEIPNYVKSGLCRFSSIHVRDEATADLVERVTGSRPDLVVDPTWLQSDPMRPCSKIPAGLKYALIYGQGATGDRAKSIAEYCRKHGLKVVSAAFPCEATTHRLHAIDPFEWVDLFRRAECVITSTFHGLLYAIKYRKPLIFMARGPSRSKSKLAIERCALQNRVVEENDPFTVNIMNQALDPANPTTLPENWIHESKSILEKTLVERF